MHPVTLAKNLGVIPGPIFSHTPNISFISQVLGSTSECIPDLAPSHCLSGKQNGLSLPDLDDVSNLLAHLPSLPCACSSPEQPSQNRDPIMSHVLKTLQGSLFSSDMTFFQAFDKLISPRGLCTCSSNFQVIKEHQHLGLTSCDPSSEKSSWVTLA